MAQINSDENLHIAAFTGLALALNALQLNSPPGSCRK
jgi:hypothetical protein